MVEIATVAELLVRIGGDSSGLRREINDAQRQLDRAFGPESLELSEGVVGLLGTLAVAMGAVGAASIKMAADMQTNQTALTQLLGGAEDSKASLKDLISFSQLLDGAEKAEAMLKALSTFAADTPFELPGIINSSKKLLAFKFAAEDVIPIMSAVGDAIALMGGGQEAIDGVVSTLGQISAKGKLSAEEVGQLSERNINAWKYVAKELGVTVPQAMKLTEQGAVDATTAINGIVNGMQSEFKGGMSALSKEIPGLLSTMKDNASTVMRELGKQIIDTFDIKTKLQGSVDYFSNFASAIESSGVKNAILGLVPPEATAAVFALAGVLGGIATYAMYQFALATWLALAPMLPFIVAGVAIGVLAYEIWKNWEPLSVLFGGLWNSILNGASLYLNTLQTNFYTAISYIMKLLVPLANLFGGSMAATVNSWAINVGDKLQILGTDSDDVKTKLQSNFGVMGNAVKKFDVGLKNIDITGLVPSAPVKPNTVFSGLHGTSASIEDSDTGAGGGGGSSSAEKEWGNLENKAEQVSLSIEKEWMQLTNTKIEELDKWKADEMKTLDESAVANENYTRDLGRLDEIYAAKKKKIDNDELNRRTNLKRAAQDIMSNYSNKNISIGFTGVDKQALDLLAGRDKEITDTTRKYEDMVKEFATLDATAKANNIKDWKEVGLAFKEIEEGSVDFTEQSEKEKLLIRKDYAEQAKQLHYERVKYEQVLDKARSDGDIAAFAAELSSKQALLAQDLSGRQEMIDVYHDAWKETHRSAMSYMAEGINGISSGLTTFFTDILSGTSSIGDAWNALGGTVKKMLAGMVADYIVGRIKMWAIEKIFGGGITGTAATQGAATAAAWAPAAALVSLATLGANAGPAMLGMGLTTALSYGIASNATGGAINGPGTGTSDSILSWLSNGEYVIKASAVRALGLDALDTLNTGQMPAFATGGLVTGRSLASMSAGRYDNVSSASNNNSTKSNSTDSATSKPSVNNFNLSLLDVKGFDKWLNDGGGERIQKFFGKQASAFAVQGAR